MEALLEPLFEIIAEIVLQILAYVIGEIVKVFDYDTKLRKTVKYVISFFFFGLSILVLVLALMHHKETLIVITISFMFAGIVSALFKYMNKNIWKNNAVRITIDWIRRVIHYAFPIVLMVFGNLTLVNKDAIIWLNIGCSFAIVVFIIMDIYRLYKFFKKRNELSYY